MEDVSLDLLAVAKIAITHMDCKLEPQNELCMFAFL